MDVLAFKCWRVGVGSDFDVSAFELVQWLRDDPWFVREAVAPNNALRAASAQRRRDETTGGDTEERLIERNLRQLREGWKRE
jgi:hypothetical protein